MMTVSAPLSRGVDHRGAAGGADLNVAADQGARHRLAAGKLDHFEILDAILFKVAAFFGGPERRLRGAEDGSGAQRFLREKTAWEQKQSEKKIDATKRNGA